MMLQFREPIKTQSRGDTHIDTGNYNAMVTKVNLLGQIAMTDPRNVEYIMNTGSRQVTLTRRTPPLDFTQFPFGVTKADDNLDRELTVQAGRFITPAGALDVAAQTVEVTGSPTEASPHYVYVEWTPMGRLSTPPAIAIEPLAEFPESDGITYRLALTAVFLDGNGTLQIGTRHWFLDHPVGGVRIY